MSRISVLLLLVAGLATLTSMAFSDPAMVKSRVVRTYNNHDTAAPLAANASDYKGQSVTSSHGAVSFTTGLDNDYYSTDSNSRSGYLYLETKVGEFVNEQLTKVPLNLSIVIDRSGSMSGDKMMYARKAAIEIINKLTADDYVSIVIYDDKVEVLQPAIQVINKAAIISKIEKIYPGGSTNLWGGSEKGYEQVKANYKPKYINRVLLISDGLVNAGLTSGVEIKRRVEQYKTRDGITLSTFGVGLDYNELLMTDMAESGAGNYHFIDSPDKMAAIFDKELNGLLNVAAQNAMLTIKLPAGVRLKKVFAFKYEEKGNELSFTFRDLFANETKGLLLQFTIDDGITGPLKFVSTLAFDNVADAQRRTLSNENILRNAPDLSTYLSYYNKKVLQQTVLFIANENMEKAMLEADKGDYNAARSVSGYNQAFLSANKTYFAGSAELQLMDSTNRRYQYQLKTAENMSRDSVQYLQKKSRSDNYKLRNKK